MKDLVERFLELVSHDGFCDTIEVDVEGEIVSGTVLQDMQEIIEEMREALDKADDAN